VSRITPLASVALVLCAGLTACSSTTHDARRVAGGTDSVTGAGGPVGGPTGPAASGQPLPGTVPGQPGAKPGQPVGTTSGGGGIASGAGGGMAPGGAGGGSLPGGGAAQGYTLGRGVTATSITIGIQVVTDTDAAFAAVGAAGAPSEQQNAQKMVDWINAHGGIAGRKVNPVYVGTQSTSGTWASQAQAACNSFANDSKVFAVIDSATGGTDALMSCLASKQIPMIERNIWVYDDVDYNKYAGYLYQPGKLSATRWVPAYIDGLAARGFFQGAKVGLVRFGGGVFDRLRNGVMKDALARNNVTLADEEILTSPASLSDFGNMNGEINNAIVKMRGAGVDHVIFLENAGEVPYFMMPAAEAQNWRPTYGLSSADIPLTLNGFVPQAQLHGSTVVSWTPPNDVAPQFDSARNANNKLCKKIYGADGFHTTSDCDALLFLQAALSRTKVLTDAGLRAAAAGLGTSYVSPMAVSSSLRSSVFFDGGAAVRYATFTDNCGSSNGQTYGCYKYVGSTVRYAR
jgi:ABC-type branched-subunit amino acid transport system substrate-binding protein